MKIRTISLIIVVILVILLILGIIFARDVCSHGIQITENINPAVKNQLTTLFGADNYGVLCMGELGQVIKLGAGGKRQVICMIKTNETLDYELKVNEIDSLRGSTNEEVQKWVLTEGWKGTVNPGGNETEAPILVLNIPKNTPQTTLKLKIIETDNTGSTKIHYSYIDIAPPPSLLESITGC